MKSLGFFRRIVCAHHKKEGRHDLPWRKTTNPYRILVSEVMLQQTQVERVIPFYKNFLKKFPTVKVLAEAPLSEVLKAWQGLGYNRRAKMLHAAAKEIVEKNKGKLPMSVEELEKLPGVGPYTARAVAAFAYNQDVVFIETNIRTAITHHFFPKRGISRVGRAAMGRFSRKDLVSDTEVVKILEKVFPIGRSREWYSALMDYGAFLKRSGVQINKKSKHYTKQSKFTGSLREARGTILRALATKPTSVTVLANVLGSKRRSQAGAALQALAAEGLIEKTGSTYRLAQ